MLAKNSVMPNNLNHSFTMFGKPSHLFLGFHHLSPCGLPRLRWLLLGLRHVDAFPRQLRLGVGPVSS